MRILHILLFLLFLFPAVHAQTLFTIEDATRIALKNNFDILVARNEADVAKINNTPGNAGMLPTLDLTGSGTYGLNNIYQKLSGNIVDRYPSQSTTTVSAGPELSWTLPNGDKMFVTKKKQNEIEALGEIQFKDKVLQTLYDVTAAFYDVVRQEQQLRSINEVTNYNRERVKIAQTGFDAGSLLKTDLLQAQIDLNVGKENSIDQQFTVDAAKKTLNKLLGQSADSVFEISEVIPFDYSPDKNELLQKLYASNTSLLSLQKQIDIAQLVLKETKKGYLPTLDLRAGYVYSQTHNSEGSTLNSRSFGPQLGGDVVIPLYSAGENRRKVSTAKIQLQSSEYDLQNMKLQIYTEFQNMLTEFGNQQQLLQIEKENNDLTKENLEISMQRLKQGQTTSLEVHQAEEYYVQSCTRLINFKYNLKIAETKLKQLVSSL